MADLLYEGRGEIRALFEIRCYDSLFWGIALDRATKRRIYNKLRHPKESVQQ